jgi:hypothetical protein
MRDTKTNGVIERNSEMWERLLLAVAVTFCLCLLFQLGGNSAKPSFFQPNFSQTSSFLFNIPIFSR